MILDNDTVALLADHLKRSTALDSYQSGAEPPEHETAYAVAEISQSALRIVTDIMPRLTKKSDQEGYWNAIEDFREEIRHISFHIRASRYLAVVLDTVTE